MERTLFYSWESDLPRETNLNFIEKSIKLALKRIEDKKYLNVSIKLDKATRNETGSPEITDSIFKKINNCSIFIADISVINHNSPNTKKTPNPNVLIELGYAARVIGWGKIICIFNTEYRNLSDLPFDLRNRRIMKYNLNSKDRDLKKKNLANQITKAIKDIVIKIGIDDSIFLFLKKKIDREVLGIILHFIRFIKLKNKKSNFFIDIQNFLEIDRKTLQKYLLNKKILGFYLLKSFQEYKNNFNQIITEATCSSYCKREILQAIINIYEWFDIYEKFWTEYSSKFFIRLKEKDNDLFVIPASKISSNSKLHDRYLLMKKIDSKKAIVMNFGDFAPRMVPYLTYYYKLNPDYLEEYVDEIMYLIRHVNRWIDLTNKEIIIDFIKQFRVKKVNGKWL